MQVGSVVLAVLGVVQDCVDVVEDVPLGDGGTTQLRVPHFSRILREVGSTPPTQGKILRLEIAHSPPCHLERSCRREANDHAVERSLCPPPLPTATRGVLTPNDETK